MLAGHKGTVRGNGLMTNLSSISLCQYEFLIEDNLIKETHEISKVYTPTYQGPSGPESLE